MRYSNGIAIPCEGHLQEGQNGSPSGKDIRIAYSSENSDRDDRFHILLSSGYFDAAVDKTSFSESRTAAPQSFICREARPASEKSYRGNPTCYIVHSSARRIRHRASE